MMWTSRRRGERGFAIFIVSAWLTMLLFVGMSVDWGILLRYRRAMENACDSGALAGALYLREQPTSAGPAAVRYASNDLTQNAIAANTPTATPKNSNTRLQVDISATVPTFFFRLVKPSVGVAVECTSTVEAVVQTKGIVPIVVDTGTFSGPCTFDTCSPVFLDPPKPSGQGSCGTNSCFLDLTNASCSGGGAVYWGCVFANGTDQTICTTSASCNQVSAVPGKGNKNGWLDKGIPPRCQTPAPPDPTSAWVVMVPLASVSSNSSPWTVTGFAAFELDCPNMPKHFTGNNAKIPGKFVYFTVMNAVGSLTATDFGLETVRLIQ